MSGLSYEPSLDAYHAAYRMVMISTLLTEDDKIPISTFRILDFYFIFPFLMREIRLKKEHGWIRSFSKSHESDRPYAKLPDGPLLFENMKIFQLAALQTLAMKQLFEIESLEKGYVAIVDTEGLREDFYGIISKLENFSGQLETLNALLREYDAFGSDGLKARTGLMEYRYDAV